MKILVASIDSDIGSQIAAQHRAAGDEVVTTSRNKKGTYHVELAHPLQWPALEGKFDKVYYTIGIGDNRSSRIEVMQINCFLSVDFTAFAAKSVKDGGQIVVLTSEWGSVTKIQSPRAPAYRMSKAALNMGIAINAQKFPNIRWTLMQPGFVQTKMTAGINSGASVTAVDSAAGVIAASEKVSLPFAFIDFQGNTVPF